MSNSRLERVQNSNDQKSIYKAVYYIPYLSNSFSFELLLDVLYCLLCPYRYRVGSPEATVQLKAVASSPQRGEWTFACAPLELEHDVRLVLLMFSTTTFGCIQRLVWKRGIFRMYSPQTTCHRLPTASTQMRIGQ